MCQIQLNRHISHLPNITDVRLDRFKKKPITDIDSLGHERKGSPLALRSCFFDARGRSALPNMLFHVLNDMKGACREWKKFVQGQWLAGQKASKVSSASRRVLDVDLLGTV